MFKLLLLQLLIYLIIHMLVLVIQPHLISRQGSPTNPLNDKDVVGLIETQTEASKKIVTRVTTPIFNRLNLIEDSLGDELLAQKINFKFGDPKLNDFSKLISQSISANKPEKKILDSWLFGAREVLVLNYIDTTTKSSKRISILTLLH